MAHSLPPIVFFGGNGHCAARLQPAREVIARRQAAGAAPGFELLDAQYPGFENRPRCSNFETFLTQLSQRLATLPAQALLHGTGIGGLLLLCLRARGVALEQPISLHAPVLWGLEKRWMPRIVQFGPIRHLLPFIFAQPWYQRRFARKQFLKPPSDTMLHDFFEGYAQCDTFPDLFDWLKPALLRDLEARFAENPAALNHIEFWWGDRDQVVSRQELHLSEQALGKQWPVKAFPHWGHYPMIDDPESWVDALQTWAELA